MCCGNNNGWLTLLIALIIMYFILNGNWGSDCSSNSSNGCGCSRERDYDNRSGNCGCR